MQGRVACQDLVGMQWALGEEDLLLEEQDPSLAGQGPGKEEKLGAVLCRQSWRLELGLK